MTSNCCKTSGPFLFKVAHLLPSAPPPSQSQLHYPGCTAPLATRRCASPPRWLAEPVGLALLLLLCLLTVRAAVVVAWCQPTPKREEDKSLLLLCPRAASNLLLLSSSLVPLASAPCQSTRLLYQPELSSNSSETSGRRRVLDSPSLRLVASAVCYGN